ncbi:hypothetical protein AK88_00496 [Plasmodium fragile]|uniref:Uncharacterized protein n=1 Tax=Plasmodium fragile TaxID=5857 RepID=A0A0D9QS89_PLAFR|nr:uncharacterized protein AK88_00496 [Plasmodium fragile]KJP89788.1 hypothetical protein AK88_00496 [Plasmodium fragile]
MDSTNIKRGLSNENNCVPDATLKTGGGAHSEEGEEVTTTEKGVALQVGEMHTDVDTVEGATVEDAQAQQTQKGRKGSTHWGDDIREGNHKRESSLTDDQLTDHKKSQGKSETITTQRDVEFHKLYESDDNNFVSPRHSSTSESVKKEELDKEKKKKKKNSSSNNMTLNTTMLQSYIHRSYDKVSNAFIKTSKSLLKRTSNITYSEEADVGAAAAAEAADRVTSAKWGSSDGVDAGRKVKSAKARLLRGCLTSSASQVEGQVPSEWDVPSTCHDRNENSFFKENFDLINKTLREDNKWGEKNKERMMGKCKKLLESNDTVKLYNEIEDLYEERILLLKFINYYMDITEKHQRELQKIQTSYEILLTENEQLSQNNITFKRHINLLRTGDTPAQE